MPDDQTTIADLRTQVKAFVAERDWAQFHSPKNLSIAIAVEAAELMEHFQWLTIEESESLVEDGGYRPQAGPQRPQIPRRPVSRSFLGSGKPCEGLESLSKFFQTSFL